MLPAQDWDFGLVDLAHVVAVAAVAGQATVVEAVPVLEEETVLAVSALDSIALPDLPDLLAAPAAVPPLLPVVHAYRGNARSGIGSGICC